MGKHKKIINNDPILQKDYKKEKRKKQRAEQRQAEHQQHLKQQKIKQQLAMIEAEVENQLHQQILQKMRVNHKTKAIQKLPTGLFAKKNKNTTVSNYKNTVSGNAQQKINKNTNNVVNKLNIVVEQNYDDGRWYQEHFGELPSRVLYKKQHRETKKDMIDRSVREQIKGMFSIQQNNNQQVLEQKNIKSLMNRSSREQQDGQTSPYILQKQSLKQKQYGYETAQGQTQHYLLTPEAANHPLHFAKPTPAPAFQLQSQIIHSYHDLVYIQNKEQQTISSFRKLTLTHILHHLALCQKSQNSKGFTNGRILILCPFFGDARSIIEQLQAMYDGYQFIGKQKLQSIEDDNDFFRIGISVYEKKKSIKYFCNFAYSDIIIGSPVGIKAIVGSQGEMQRDFSFLSSIQILYIDRASVIYMQNWDHILQILKSLNLLPSQHSLTNSISKLRAYIPQLKSKLYRQSIIFSQYNFPQLNSIKHLHFHNYKGCFSTKIQYKPIQMPENKVKLGFDVQYYKLDIKEAKEDLEARFLFFKRKFWDLLCNQQKMKKVVIMVRSYFQYLKLKQFLTHTKSAFSYISEHTKKPSIQSRISQFNANKYRILLTTQRTYYYNICQIKKFQHIYFYSLPRNAHIFQQLIAEVYKQSLYTKNKVVCIYTRYDLMFLEKIVGTKKAYQMVKQYCNNVSFIV